MGAPVFTTILGQPTGSSITMGVRCDTAVEVYFEYGLKSGVYAGQTKPVALTADPNATGFFLSQIPISGLEANTRYYYRMQFRAAGSSAAFTPGQEGLFHMQRAPGSTFVFAAQGDSHPERERNMFHPALYSQTLKAVAAEQPDFYITSGDDFSVDTLPTPYTRASVTGRYTLQLPYFHLLGAPLFLGTGNHEETSLSNYNLPRDAANSNQVPIWAQNARNLYYPSPGPNDAASGRFYSGNATALEGIGLLRDYYAWEWGDALFVVIDPYWSSPVQVDTGLGGQNGSGGRTNDKWAITHGDAQYQWLKQTLEQSKAKWKFVFAHHVMGTGRGGIEIADQFEWGGRSNNGAFAFPQNRPGWAMPIHQLMAANHVTIFFQAHDHLFAHQVRDGVTYQSLPNPADNTYTAFNADAYTGDVFPNAGYTKVTVNPSSVKVDYVRQWLPADEKPPTQVSGAVQFSYTIPAGASATPAISSIAAAGGRDGIIPNIAPNTWIEIKGSNLAPATSSRIWQSADFSDNRMPTRLDGVSVTVNGKPAYVYYVSPTQVNALTPPDALPATAAIQITVGSATSAAFSAPAAAVAPALFTFNGTPYVAATHLDGSLVGPASLYPGSSSPAKPGETVVVYGNGFGPTSIPVVSGSTVQSGSLTPAPAITIGGAAASVPFAGLVSPGEYQFNIVVPANAPDGDLPIGAQQSGTATASGVLLTIRR
ncbi:MAG: metallophosphoesterase [Bryobacteraceae bacterium]